ncbi:MAG: lysophospholipid acyltransferase family protein [Gallionellaceae bacterium]|nr:MAG: lysophospholipid acyltransferase family protein [Gallionellaceae bacterium]
MSSSLAFWLFGLMSRLPLSVLHRLGVVAGWLTYLTSRKYAERLNENLLNGWDGSDEAEFQRLLEANVAESGKGVAELPWMWRRPLAQVVASVKECHGWELVEAAQVQGKGLIILTPHIGCFEVIGQYVGDKLPMTCMYRVPKLAWLDKVMRAGRERGQMKLARADIGGVRTLLKALKRGEVIGVLPDQVPGSGEGEWAPFFGRPAYTMTLVKRLLESSGAAVVMCYAQRLPQGGGYAMHFSPFRFDAQAPIPQQMNAALEAVIRTCPEQYLWSYNRYKIPRGAQPPETPKEQ